MPPPCHTHVLITNKTVPGNVAFLVRHNYGPDINIDHVSVPVINFLAQYDRPAQRIYVIFQKDLERSRDILSVDTEEGQNFIECLKKEVDKMIMYIMGYETTANSHIDSGKE
jgi:hypothetical protein